jgi:hypothetical protein
MPELRKETQETSGQPTSGTRMTRRNLASAAALVASALAMSSTKVAAQVFPRPEFPRPTPGGGGTQCFLRGTFIRTPEGEVEVSTLKAGDLVTTASGEAKPIKRIGYRAVGPEEAALNSDEHPVKVAQGAIDDVTPKSDLYLSRNHALYLNGMLIPVSDLINGRTIAVATDMPAVTFEYFHIELDGHDVIFANGAACETLLFEAAPAARVIPFAPLVSFFGGRGALASRLRSAASPLIDRRRPIDIVRDRLEDRAERSLAA